MRKPQERKDEVQKNTYSYTYAHTHTNSEEQTITLRDLIVSLVAERDET